MIDNKATIRAKQFAAQTAKRNASVEAALFKDIPALNYIPLFKALHKLYPLERRY